MQKMSNNTITGQIDLNNTLECLTEAETQKLRIYWEWADTENDVLPTGAENYYIISTINIKQKV